MKGKLIIIEAGDGSGKATQAEKLYARLKAEKYKVKKIEFPNYKSNSSALIKMYLQGEFGPEPDDVNPFVASTFYAVDRYASYKKEWESFYLEGGIIISDRYTTSNMVHQAAKIENPIEKEKYLQWLWDLEFNKMGLPIPDKVIFLNVPPQYSQKLVKDRANKFTGGVEKDIHERNQAFLESSYQNACAIAAKYNWYKIDCLKNAKLKTIEEIHEEIYRCLIPNVYNY